MFFLADAPVVLKGLSSHALLILLVQITLLLAVARGLGELMRKLKQPAVVGELLAGLILGPSVLGKVLPNVQAALFPPEQAQSDLLTAISWLGVLMLLIVTGLEVDLDLVVRKAKTALGISLGGILVPFVSGFALGWLLPESFLAKPDQRLIFSLFMAVAMSISAIPVIAKVLIDLDLIRRDVGQVILAAAMTDDTIGWILLSVVAGLATKGTVNVEVVLGSLISAVVFVWFGMKFGPKIMNKLLIWVDDEFHGPAPQLSVIMVMALGSACLTHILGIEAVLGAFVVGIVAARASRLQFQVTHTLELITGSLLAPIFFATAGLKVNLWGLFSPSVALMGLVALAVACFGKFVGCYLGGMVAGLPHWERLAMGSGMNARGAMEIIVATMGLSLGVLNQDTYSIIVGIAIITSLMAPPMLRWSLSHVEMGPDEMQRLERERRDQTSFLAGVRRILLPVRGGRNGQMAAALLGCFGSLRRVEVTSMYVQLPNALEKPEETFAQVGAEFQTYADRQPTSLVVKGNDVVSAILERAQRGFNLLVVGASETRENHMFDQLMQGSPCATMLVKAFSDAEKGPAHITKILVPTIGTHYSSNAVETAGLLGSRLGVPLTLLHIVPEIDEHALLIHGQRAHEVHQEFAEQIVDTHADLARHLGAEVTTTILEGNHPEKIILAMAQQEEYGLIVLGANLRPLRRRAFLGHRVEKILSHAECAVVVVSTL